MVKITSGDELVDVLRKALQIEMGFEDSSIWEGYIETDEGEIRDLLFTLSSDSHNHAKMVESMIGMVITEGGEGSLPLQKRAFNFKNMKDSEILDHLLKYDRLAYNLYVDIQTALQGSDLKMIQEGKQEEFMTYLERLLRDERKHIDLLARSVGFIQRIR